MQSDVGMGTSVEIRPLVVEDSRVMADVLSSTDLYTYIGGRPPTREELSTLYARQTTGRSPDGLQEWLNWIVIVNGEQAVGYVQASRPVGGSTAEIAWVIGRPWQGQGYATSAARLMLAELNARGTDEVTADIHPSNHASATVARRLGMSPTDEVVDGEIRWTGITRPSTARLAGDL